MITIVKSPTADSRTAGREVTIEELKESTKRHIWDVQKAMSFFCSKLYIKGSEHDQTKRTDIQGFHDCFIRSFREKDFDFKRDCSWYHDHIKQERHHLNDHEPDDVDLFDVLERIADIVMAAKGRGLSFSEDILPEGLLERAYQNTIKALLAEVQVEATND